MTELRVAVRMIRTFLRLPVALQAVILIAQKLRHFLITDRMLLPSQLRGQCPGALAYAAQGGFGIAPRFRFNQMRQRGEKLRIAHGDFLTARTRSEAHTSELQS